MRLLVVSDDAAPRRLHARALRQAGLAVDEARTVARSAVVLAEVAYDGLVVDHELADGDGLALAAVLDPAVAVVVVAATRAVGERIDVLERGADDCVAPPVDPEELVLRTCKALVRRTAAEAGPVRLGRVVVDRSSRLVTIDDRPVHLSRRPLCVLDHLVAHRHRLVSGNELLEHCWELDRDEFTNPLPSQLTRLRSTFVGCLRIPWSDRGGYLLEVVGGAG